MANVVYVNPTEINLRVIENTSEVAGAPKWIYYAVEKGQQIGSDDKLEVEITNGSDYEIPVNITPPANYELKGTDPSNGNWKPAKFASEITYPVPSKDINHSFACNIRESGDKGDGVPVDPIFRLQKTGG